MSERFATLVEAARSASTPLESRTCWQECSPQLEAAAPRVMRVALCGTFTTEQLEPYVGLALLKQGIAAQLQHSPYNQVYQELLSPGSTLRRTPAPDVVVVFWRMEELLAEALQILPQDPAAARAAAERELTQFLQSLRAFLDHSAASMIVSNPPRPQVRPYGLIDARLDEGASALHAEVLSMWRRMINAEPRLHLLDLDGAQRDFGARAAANPKMWLLARMPWTETFCLEVAAQTARVVRALVTPPRKVLVMDCDNTLWGGVVGEDGALGVDVGEDAPGNAYAELQRYALALRRQGILLAVVSKNNEADAWEVFDRHPGMVLRREHLAAWRVNWLPKAQNLRAIAEELKLGSDSLVFVDDSPAECAEVRANAPEVLTIHLDCDPSQFVQRLEEACAFDRLSLTKEDVKRAEMYSQERQRETLRASTTSMEDYLAGLDLTVRIERVGQEHLPRVTQLINKTNQFNMTTIRRTEAEVRALWQDPDWRLFAVWVSDRFGDYGLTAAAVCHARGLEWFLDTFLMSCRVLARGVETSLLASLVAAARAEGKEKVRGQYLPTAKNAMAADVYRNHGFEDLGDGWFARSTHAPIVVPSHLRLEGSAVEGLDLQRTPAGIPDLRVLRPAA